MFTHPLFHNPAKSGYPPGDNSPKIENLLRHPATNKLATLSDRGCSAPPARNIQDSSKPEQLIEEIGSRDNHDAGTGERSPGVGLRSLNACLEGEEGVSQDEKASGALSSGGGSNESTEWHSCSSVLIATQDLQYRKRNADTAGDASDESSQWGDFCSARRWTQGVKASAGRRRRFVPDDSETSDNDHVAVDNVLMKPFDLCEQFKEKVTLAGETCIGQEAVTKGSQSEQEKASYGYCSGRDGEIGVFGDILEPQSMSVAQVSSPRVSSTTKPTAPGDYFPDEAVLVKRKPGKQRRFVISDDSDSDEPVFGRKTVSRKAKRDVAKTFPVELSVPVTASTPFRASSGGEEPVGCDSKSPAPLNNLGVRKNGRNSPSNGGGVDYDEDDKYAGGVRKTPGKQICSRRRFVLESSDESSAKKRGGKCEAVIGTSASRVSPMLGGVAAAGVPLSLVEGVAGAASVRPSPYRSKESDPIGKGDCVRSSDSSARGDSIPREGFGSGAESNDDWKPRSRKLDRGGSRYPRRCRNVLGHSSSSSSDDKDSVTAGSLRSGGDVCDRNGPLSPDRRRLIGSTSPPLAKPACFPGHERQRIDASESESMSHGVTPRRLGCSPVQNEDHIVCSSIGSGIDDDRQGGGRSTKLLSKGSRRIPIPRQGRIGIGVGYGIETPSVASDLDGGASSRDSIPLGGHTAGGLVSPVKRRRARRQNGIGRRSARVQISEEGTMEELSGSAFSKARDRCSTCVCV